MGRCGYIDIGIELDSGLHTTRSAAESLQELYRHVDSWHTLDWVESMFPYPSWPLEGPAVLENGILMSRDESNSTLAFLELPTRMAGPQHDINHLRSWSFDKMERAPYRFTLDAGSDLVAYLDIKCAVLR